MKKDFTAHLIFAATVLASQQTWALGFGRVVPDAVLGQTLTFSVPVHVEPGERFGLDCVSADVYYGESRLTPNLVRTAVEHGNGDNEWLVRITTVSPIDEPVVELSVSAGCGRRFVRRFTAFADPPNLSPAQAVQVQQAGSFGTLSQPIVLAPIPNGVERASASTADASGGSIAGASTGASARRARRAAASASAADHPHVIRKGPTMALANEMSTAAEAPAAPVPARRGSAAAADVPSAHKPGPRVVASASSQAPRLLLDNGYAHLKLDMEEPLIPAHGAPSGIVAAAPPDVDDVDTKQLHELEQSIQAMRRASQANHDQTARLQAELADAQSRSDWLPYVWGLLALAVAAAAALAWRLRQQSRLAHSVWFTESQQMNAKGAPEPVVEPVIVAAPVVAAPPPPLEEPVPSVAGELVGEPLDSFLDDPLVLRSAGGGGVAGDVGSTTRPLDRAALAGVISQEAAPQPRELSVEELLDLEQQADFFIALGQEDAAIDLLMSHLRSAGGQSPLPYTKLLEIYRRQEDRSAYERTRARFNRRFNAYAPDWDTGPGAGRVLEDYPDTVAQIQAAWHSPIDAMAVLEAMLFKRDDTSELFDLPAYRDVLVLYSLARDLWQQGGGNAGTQVDVLLPLDDIDDAPFLPPAPHPAPEPARAAFHVPAPVSAPTSHPSLPDLDDLELPLEVSLPTSFDLPPHAAGPAYSFDVPETATGGLDFELPHLPDDDAHLDRALDDMRASLDALSLAPIEPTKPPSALLDWDATDLPSDDSLRPKKR